MVSFTVIFAMTVSFLATTLAPIVLLIVLGVKKKVALAPLGLGFASFFVSQLLLRTPILNALSQQSWWSGFASQTVLYIVFLAFTASLFEESAKFCGAMLLKEHRGYWDAISFGMGHAFCEIFLIYSISLLDNLLFCYMINIQGTEAVYAIFPADQAQQVIDQFLAIRPGEVFAAMMERISAIFFHLFATMLIFQGVVQRRYWYTLLAIAAHIVFNLASALTGLWANLWITEIILLVLGIAGLVYVIKQRKNSSFPKPVRRLKQY